MDQSDQKKMENKIKKMTPFSLKVIGNYIGNVCKLRFLKNPILKPYFISYYITKGCNFNCAYCDYARSGDTRRFDEHLSTEEVFRLLKILREACPNIYFTGGEPLLRADIVEILKECQRLKFNTVSMVSNMSMMHQKMEVLEYISHLTVSLDMLDEQAYSEVIGMPSQVVKQVKENIILCARLRKEKGFSMAVNFVANKKTVPHAISVIEFCTEHDIKFTIGPEVGPEGKVPDEIKNDEEYKELIRKILTQRKTNKLLIDNPMYLNKILNFDHFDCHPTLTPRIESDGTMLYPCKILRNHKINLLEIGSYDEAIKMAVKKYGHIPKCTGRCYMNCYIVPSEVTKHPLSVLQELKNMKD